MWWSGAVLAHGAIAPGSLEGGVASVEKFYASRRAVARFQICADCPPWLDEALAHRGYQLECPMSLQVAEAKDIADRLSAPSLRVHVMDHPDPAWFAIWHAVSAAESPPGSEWRLLQRIQRPSAYVTVLDSDQPIAVGRAVADTGWAGVFGMATLPAARRRGAAKSILSAIAGWALNQRAPHIYLQVERDNVAAKELYERACFTEIATYHYRVQRSP
jgi:GNAT superfamily N-acetyltransferase